MTGRADVFDIAGRVVWVTGSSRGIGHGIAMHLARAGAVVVVHARSEPAATGAELDELGADWSSVVADVRDEEQMERAVATIVDRHGRLDALVANVGAARWGPAADITLDGFRKAFAVNLDGSFACARAARAALEEQRGSVVFVSAAVAGTPTPNFAPYGAAKAAVEHLTGTLAAEWGPAVRVNCVAPGIVLTEGSAAALFDGDDAKVAAAGTTTAVGRVGTPQDVAAAVHYLVSDAAGYVSGHVLAVDGGQVEGPADRVTAAVRGT